VPAGIQGRSRFAMAARFVGHDPARQSKYPSAVSEQPANGGAYGALKDPAIPDSGFAPACR